MDKIAVLPGIIALGLLLYRKDPKKLFLYYFLPILTLIPAYYETKLVSGIPEFSFWSSALLPIFAAWVINDKMKGYKLDPLDIIILINLSSIFFAEYNATGYKEAQKLLFQAVTQRLIPYMMIKALLYKSETRISVLKIISILGAIVAVFMVYEFKFYFNYLDIPIRRIWPYHVPWDGVMSRYGFKRAAGSFGHPISAGYFFVLSSPIAFWLWRHRHFKKNKHGMLIFGLNILGILTSISRAPIAGMLIGFILIWFGWSKEKKISGGLLIVISIMGLSIILPKFIDYISVTRAEAKTVDQENAAYRKEMLDNYFIVIEKKPYWGYGRYTYPIINRQKSIDNEYLFIALTTGLVTLGIYILFMIWVMVILIRFISKRSWDDPNARLAWAILAGWIAAIFTQATVYGGIQTVHYFYMVAALAQVIVKLPKNETDANSSLDKVKVPKYNFARII